LFIGGALTLQEVGTAIMGNAATGIHFPSKYMLNMTGVEYCIRRQIPMQDLHGWDGRKAVGFEWRTCRADLIEKLVMLDLLSHIEINRPEFVSIRNQLISMTQSILTGAFTARFRSELRRRIASEPTLTATFAKPSAMALLADYASIAAALQSQARRIALIRAAIKAECGENSPNGISPFEIDEGPRSIDGLIDAIDNKTMLTLALAGPNAVRFAAEMALVFARRIGLAGHLSLLLMELIQIAEKSYFQSLTSHDRVARAHPEEVQSLLAEPEYRERLIRIATQRGESMILDISFDGLTGLCPGSGVLGIAVRTKGLIGQAWLGMGRMSRADSLKTTNLECLLKSAARDDQFAELSLAYYAAFEEACARENIGFTSSVILDGKTNETVTTMRIAI
jgi:hypothetical protein